jgi:hypothetical protein
VNVGVWSAFRVATRMVTIALPVTPMARKMAEMVVIGKIHEESEIHVFGIS